MRKGRPARTGLFVGSEKGRGHGPPEWLAERLHLKFGSLPTDGLAGEFDMPFERLPGFANDLLVGGHGALGGHAERVGLEGHVGREFTFALRSAVEADGTVEIFVAAVVGELGGRVTRFGDGAGVELAGAVGRSDIGPDDALEVDLHRALAQAVL